MAERRENRRPWVKLWSDAIESRQIHRAGEAAELLFYRLLMVCGRSGVGGVIPETADEIAWRLRMDPADVAARLAALESQGLVEVVEAGVLITGWNERQADKSEAERKRDQRATRRDDVPRLSRDKGGTCPATVQDMSRDTSRTCPTLDVEEDVEEEEERTHAQPCGEYGGATPVPGTAASGGKPSAPARIGSVLPTVTPPPKTDADLRPIFDAYCRGSGQSLTWRQQHILPSEQVARFTRDADQVARVAKFYRGQCKEGTPSFARFAAEFDRWRAEAEARAKPPGARASPTPEQLIAAGKCPEHPGQSLDDGGNCEVCVDLAEYLKRHAEADDVHA